MARTISAYTSAIIEYCLMRWKSDFRPKYIVPTIRQYFYLCAVAEIVAKSDVGYRKVQTVLARARERGDFPWVAVYDGLRQLQRPNVFDDLDDYKGVVRQAYHRDKWADQPRQFEVWIEKDAVRGTVQSVVHRYEVPLLVDRGYASLTAKNEALMRLSERPLTIIYIGDHDPSGINMLNEAELWLRIASNGEKDLVVDRIAITDADHADGTLMHIPVNSSDSRAGDYRRRYGGTVVEVEALPPQVLQERLAEAIERHRDPDVWERSVAQERDDIDELNAMLDGEAA